MLVVVPAYAMMRDPEFYPNPDNFSPEENFSDEAKSKRSPYTFLTFGQGPRNCLGMRFAQLQVKIAILRLLESYEVLPCEKTPGELVHDPTSLNGAPLGGVWVKVLKRSGRD